MLLVFDLRPSAHHSPSSSSQAACKQQRSAGGGFWLDCQLRASLLAAASRSQQPRTLWRILRAK